MRKQLLYDEYSEDKKHRIEIYKHNNMYDLWVQDYDEEWECYYDRRDGRHLIDTLDGAKELGKQLLLSM